MTFLKLTLEYDGTDFVGWQLQPNGRSVQEELEKGLARLCGEPVRVTGAGRTVDDREWNERFGAIPASM